MKDSMANDVLGRIKHGEIRMRPRWHFVVTSVLTSAVTVMLTVVMAYGVSLAYLAARIQLGDRPMYGARFKLDTLISDFPWLLAVLLIMGCWLLVAHLRRTSRLYRVRPTWLILAIVTISVVLGTLLSLSPFGALDHTARPAERQGKGYGRMLHGENL